MLLMIEAGGAAEELESLSVNNGRVTALPMTFSAF